ncbi:MAG: hypothetical protein E4H03_03780 [Myxococcales bacterium]|nr:MAG: hypothetical protein E4H03_03780 [Myxococcales bacterium]
MIQGRSRSRMTLPRALAGSRASLNTAAHAVVYAALRVLWLALSLLPLSSTRRFLEGVAGWVGRFDRRHRDVIRSNLMIAFPDWSGELCESVVDLTFRNWGRVAAEVLHARRMVRDADTDWVERAEAMLSQLCREGRGVLVLTAHTANFELLGRIWGLASGRRITVLHRPMGNRVVDSFLRRERARMNVDTLGRGSAARDVLTLIARGGLLAAPLDQNQPPGRPGVFVEMFGRPAATATVLARLSLATGAPVLPVFAVWSEQGPGAVIGDPIEPGPRGQDRDEAIRRLTTAYTVAVEEAVRRHPDQWNWAHRRWKTRPEDISAPKY